MKKSEQNWTKSNRKLITERRMRCFGNVVYFGAVYTCAYHSKNCTERSQNSRKNLIIEGQD